MEKYITNNKVFYHPEIISAWQSGQSVNPISAELHISNKCNNACYYCGRQAKDADMMEEGLIFEAIEYLAWLNVKSITFTGGGEPTLNPAFEHVIKYTQKKGMDIGIITNGVNLNNDLILMILAYAKWIRISMDAVDDEMYHAIRGVDKCRQVISNTTSLLTLRDVFNKDTCIIGIQVVVNKHNYKELSQICGRMLKLFPTIDYIHFRPIETMIDDNLYSESELDTIFRQLSFLKKKKKVIVSDKWNLFQDQRIFGFKTCHAAEFLGVVDVKGDFYPCCHVIGRPEYRVLNVFNDSTKDFIKERGRVLQKLGNKGFNAKVCPLACRGSQINIALDRFLTENHKNFL